MKTAILFGATGLIGNELVGRIPDDPHYSKLVIFVRRKFRTKFLNAEVHEVDFENPDSFAHLVKGDDCFCSLGTTRSKAGSKEAFRKIDFDLVVKIAAIASANGVKKFIAVSSIGANAASSNFYLRTKGEMENAVSKIPFEQVVIVQPSLLLGKRREFRLGERIGILFAKIISPLMIGPLLNSKPIKAKTVAKAMIALVNSSLEKNVFVSSELQELGTRF